MLSFSFLVFHLKKKKNATIFCTAVCPVTMYWSYCILVCMLSLSPLKRVKKKVFYVGVSAALTSKWNACWLLQCFMKGCMLHTCCMQANFSTAITTLPCWCYVCKKNIFMLSLSLTYYMPWMWQLRVRANILSSLSYETRTNNMRAISVSLASWWIHLQWNCWLRFC